MTGKEPRIPQPFRAIRRTSNSADKIDGSRGRPRIACSHVMNWSRRRAVGNGILHRRSRSNKHGVFRGWSPWRYECLRNRFAVQTSYSFATQSFFELVGIPPLSIFPQFESIKHDRPIQLYQKSAMIANGIQVNCRFYTFTFNRSPKCVQVLDE